MSCHTGVIDAGLLVSRAAVGLGEGVAPSAATDMVARIGKDTERSRSMSFIFGGLHVGSLLGLLVAPQLIEQFGWQTVRPGFIPYVAAAAAESKCHPACFACGCSLITNLRGATSPVTRKECLDAHHALCLG